MIRPRSTPLAHPRRSAAWGVIWLLSLGHVLLPQLQTRAAAQAVSPVSIDDSPWAWELLQRARDQALANPTDAARQIDTVLSRHASQLVPWPAGPGDLATTERFRSARAAANELLLAHPAVLERWRASASVAARRLLDAGEVEEALRVGLLSKAGLEAALRLTQRDVESGRFFSALRRLDEVREHPDRRLPAGLVPGSDASGDARLALHALILEGLACAGAGDSQGAASAMAALRRAGGPLAEAGADAVARLLADGRPRQGTTTATPMDQTEALELPEASEAPAWQLLASLPLPNTVAGRAAREGVGPRDGVQRPTGGASATDRGSLLAAVPTLVDDTVLVNDGGTVHCFDRLGGRLRWTRDLVQSPARLEVVPPMDPSLVVPAGEVVVTLTGHGAASARAGGDRLVCLDARSGELRWQRSLNAPGRAGEQEGFFPLGTPVVVDSTVCVIVRKVTGRLETMTYVVGISLEDGSTRWLRHHSSSAGVRLGGQRPITTLFQREGLLYASASTGAVACIEPVSGEFRWLRRFPVPIRDPLYEAEPWEIGGATPGEEFVVLVEPDQGAVSVLQREDGSTLDRRPIGRSEPWGQPRYLLEVPADESRGLPELIVAVGSDVAVFDARNLSSPQWRLSRSSTPGVDLRDGRLGVRGRVQVVGRRLLVPMQDRTLLVDADSGEAHTLLESSPPGVALLAQGQLLLAAADRLLISMPFDAAKRILREQLAASPDDPNSGLSLLALAVRSGSLPLGLEAGEATLAALTAAGATRRAEEVREELVGLLLIAERRDLAASDAQGEALLELLNRAAATPQQRSLASLARADWLAGSGRRDEAIQIWQQLLDDEAPAGTLLPSTGLLTDAFSLLRQSPDGPATDNRTRAGVSEDAAWRALDVEVLERVARWRRSDPRMSEALELAATKARAGLGDRAQPETLRGLAERFPGTAAGEEAFREAVVRQLQSGDALAALRGAGTAWRASLAAAAPTPKAASAILAPLIDASLAAATPARAVALLRNVEQRLGGEGPTALGLLGGERSVEAIRREGARTASALPVRRPRLGTLSGEAIERPGRVLRTQSVPGMAPVRLPPDIVLLHHDGAVRCIDSERNERWALALEEPDPRILRFDERGLLLWTTHGGDAAALLVDPRRGTLRWRTRAASELLPQASGLAVGDAMLPTGGLFDPAEIVPLLAGDRLVLLRRTGEIASIDLAAGPESVWRRPSSLLRVHSAWCDDATILLGGVDERGRPGVVAIDAVSGREFARWRPPLGSEVRWVLGTPDGVGIVATDGGLEALDLDAAAVERPLDRHEGEAEPDLGPPRTLWRTSTMFARATSAGWLVGSSLVVADALEGLSAFDVDDGSAVPARFEASPDVDGVYRLRDLHVDEEGIVALFQERAVAYALDGRVVGRDAVAEIRDYRAMVVGGEIIALISADTSEQVETPLGRRTQYPIQIHLLDRDRGCKLVGPMLRFVSLGQRIERVAAVDGALLLSTASTVTWIPLGTPRGHAGGGGGLGAQQSDDGE